MCVCIYRANEVRGSEETFGAPERVIKVCSVPFQLRRKSAVDDGDTAGVFEKVCHKRRRIISVG